MTFTDSPDFQVSIVTVDAMGDVPDAPDFQTIAVAPGGLPVGFANPMTTAGDLIDGGASGTPQRLGIGTTGQVLTVVSGAPAWAAAGGGGSPSPGDVFASAGCNGITMWPSSATAGASMVSGVTFIMAFTALKSVTVNNVNICVNSTGTGTANECYVGIYNSSVTLLGSSAAGTADSAFSSLGWHQIALSAGVALTAGTLYYAAVLFNGSPIPKLYSANGDAEFAVNPPFSHTLYGKSNTTSTTLPSPLFPVELVEFTFLMYV